MCSPSAINVMEKILGPQPVKFSVGPGGQLAFKMIDSPGKETASTGPGGQLGARVIDSTGKEIASTLPVMRDSDRYTPDNSLPPMRHDPAGFGNLMSEPIQKTVKNTKNVSDGLGYVVQKNSRSKTSAPDLYSGTVKTVG